jgi:hypothetical protein
MNEPHQAQKALKKNPATGGVSVFVCRPVGFHSLRKIRHK